MNRIIIIFNKIWILKESIRLSSYNTREELFESNSLRKRERRRKLFRRLICELKEKAHVTTGCRLISKCKPAPTSWIIQVLCARSLPWNIVHVYIHRCVKVRPLWNVAKSRKAYHVCSKPLVMDTGSIHYKDKRRQKKNQSNRERISTYLYVL